MTGEIISYATFLASRQRRQRVIAEFKHLSTRVIKNGITPGVAVTIDRGSDTRPVADVPPQGDIDRHGQRPSNLDDATDQTPSRMRYWL